MHTTTIRETETTLHLAGMVVLMTVVTLAALACVAAAATGLMFLMTTIS